MLKREDKKNKKGLKWTTCTFDLYSIYSQETTQFGPKYIKAMSLGNSTPTHLSNDDERGVFAAATTARNSSMYRCLLLYTYKRKTSND